MADGTKYTLLSDMSDDEATADQPLQAPQHRVHRQPTYNRVAVADQKERDAKLASLLKRYKLGLTISIIIAAIFAGVGLLLVFLGIFVSAENTPIGIGAGFFFAGLIAFFVAVGYYRKGKSVKQEQRKLIRSSIPNTPLL